MKYWNKQRTIMLSFWLIVLILYELLIFVMLGFLFNLKNISYQKILPSIIIGWKHNIGLSLLVTFGLTILYFLIALAFIHFKSKNSHYIKTAKTKEHGGAQWIIDEETSNNANKLKKFNEIYSLSSKSQKSGWVVRTKNIKDKTIFNIRSQTQALCLGTTGSGKTQKIIIPSAIYNARLNYDEKPCMVFTDPKGELYQKLNTSLQLQGYEILVLNIREPKFSNGWNPLIMAYKYYYDAVTFKETNFKTITFNNFNDLKIMISNKLCYIHNNQSACAECLSNVQNQDNNYQIYLFNNHHWLFNKQYSEKLVNSSILELKAAAYEEVEDLVSTLFPLPKNDNPMWTQNAARMTAGVIYALLEILDSNLNDLPLARFNLTTVSVLLANQENLVVWFKMLGQINPTSKAFITAAPVVNSAEVTRQGAFSNIGPALKIFEDLGLQNIVCRNDIDLFKFTDKPKALFLIVPDEKTNRHIIGSLFISQLYKASVFIANNNGGKLQRVIQFYLDEFGNMPTIPNFATFITVARSRNMFFLLVLQDFKQLYEKYGEQNGLTIRNNCNLNIYIQTNDHYTAETYSKMIGDYTIISSSISKETNKSGKKGGSSSQTGIPLIKASDLMRLKDPYGVVIYAKENPAKIYMEYAYNCPSFNLGTYNPIDKLKVNAIDFYQDHYFNLLTYDRNPQFKEKTELDLKQELHDETDGIYNKSISQLLAQESIIKDNIYQLENQDYELLTTDQKIDLTVLRDSLMKVRNKLNNFSNQAE